MANGSNSMFYTGTTNQPLNIVLQEQKEEIVSQQIESIIYKNYVSLLPLNSEIIILSFVRTDDLFTIR